MEEKIESPQVIKRDKARAPQKKDVLPSRWDPARDPVCVAQSTWMRVICIAQFSRKKYFLHV